ncbi:ATP-grasp domain-containing protein [Anaeromicropila populeti]|uniref:SSU ribosomal protein S6P modification protein n=1 Tax=Anaeromicropila populeti TaxID=37658 RepID=A0A1I6L0V6_9FIRM|nr:RimK family alpha-L-glutamate ligase [Anaeromicropila populeti]SFR97084.1 SSU ribosomal protein S6P modification protein [Anaeromicropila populeti]
MNNKIGIVSMTLDKWEMKEICKYINQNGFEYEMINRDNTILKFENSGFETKKYHSVYGRVERPILQEGLMILKFLEMTGEKIYNNALAIQYGQNKAYTSVMLSAAGIPHPKTIFAFPNTDLDNELENLQFPVVMKPWIGGRGAGIVKAQNIEIARSYIEILKNGNQPIYIQEYVRQKQNEKLRDMRVFVVGGKPLGVFYREATEKGWKTNICNGGIGKVCELNSEIATIATKAMTAIHADIGGVDVIESEDGYNVLEVNVCPLFGGFYKVTGINPAEKIAELLCSK